MLDDVDLFGEAVDFLGFEVERIAGDEEAGIGAALEFQETADFFECAATRGDVVVGFVGFEVLRFKVEDDVAAGDDLGSGVIVFDVIGAEAHAAVGDVHVVVGDVHAADAALRPLRGNFRDAAGGRLSGNLLRENRCGKKSGNEKERVAAEELSRDGNGKEKVHAANQSMKSMKMKC
jgi:hypothetical protein